MSASSRLFVCLAGISLVVGALAAPAAAQPPPAAASDPQTTVFVRNWTRLSGWSFFEPPPSGGDHDYVYVANRLQAGLRSSGRRFEGLAALQYVQFGGLPSGAVGPGPLGLGAVYFGHAGARDSHQVYLRYLSLRVKDLGRPGLSVEVGRMGYTSGAEAASGNPKIEAVKRQRVDSRLIGEFEWSIYQRGYDGLRVGLSESGWSATAIAYRPTQGGFEEAAGVGIDDITVVGGSVTLAPGTVIPHTEWQLFGYRYDDSREVRDRPDNTGRRSDRVDVAVNTFGATLVSAIPAGAGTVDALLWVAGQQGTWYEQSHRGFSVAAEAGYQWSEVAGRPWLRGGLLWASGDDDPTDDRHGTFFQLLPTVRRFSQTTAYSQMNLVDVFGQVLWQPHAKVGLRLDVHKVGLANAADRWYFGSGATQEEGAIFGFGTRPSFGRKSLGTTVEASANVAAHRNWSLNGFAGYIRGGDIVRPAFDGRSFTFAYLENVVQF